ncbi:MAG TPA: hypothetical protein VKX96_07195 [Chloroflexota bacterium]|jgi:hypothetical protein|nr:hypothetical protein [Chloroflexota bacterium]
MPFQIPGSLVVGEETVTEATAANPTSTPEVGNEAPAVGEAIRIIQRHIDKEARNRWVEHLEVRDLCPRQKADLVNELARLF